FLFFFFFFFQAEDGIRDLIVTGVQTCALPIFAPRSRPPRSRTVDASDLRRDFLREETVLLLLHRRGIRGDQEVRVVQDDLLVDRSEERRVGKECRSGGGGEG